MIRTSAKVARNWNSSGAPVDAAQDADFEQRGDHGGGEAGEQDREKLTRNRVGSRRCG